MILLPVHAQEISAVSEPQAVSDGTEVLSEEDAEEIAAKPIVKDDASAREVESELNEDPEAQR